MTVLISGAANGLGAALVDIAQARGHQTVGLDNQWGASSGGLQIDADLSDHTALVGVLDEVVEKGPYDVVIHNAAVSASGPFEAIPATAHNRLIDINVTAPLLITKRLLSEGALQKKASLVFVASLSVFVGYPGAASYAASKAAIANYANSLRKAFKAEGLHVLVVYPGPMNTAQASRHAPKGAKAEKRMEAQTVAEQIFTAIDKRHPHLVPGQANRVFATLGRFFPGAMGQVMKKIIYDKLDKAVY